MQNPTVGKKHTLLLVDPYPRNNPYHLTASERRAVWFPKLSLPVIAAYTPADLGRLLVDEAVQDIDFDQPCDLVGLSIMTCYAPRAYEIATEFRKRGKTVVLGGVHPTYCPEEAFGLVTPLCAVKLKICGPKWSPTSWLAQ